MIEVFVPKMSDHMAFGEIISWAAREGDAVQAGQVLLEVQSDKAVVELEAPASGILTGVRAGAEPGAVVPVGETIAFIAAPGESAPVLSPLSGDSEGSAVVRRVTDRARAAQGPELPSALSYTESAQRRRAGATAPVETTGRRIRAVPAARRLARDLGVDLIQIEGSGPQGQIRVDDVRSFASRRPSVREAQATPSISDSAAHHRAGDRAVESLSPARLITLTIDADMTRVLSLQKALAEMGQHLSIKAVLVKVVAQALREHPRCNASPEGDDPRRHDTVNIGVINEMGRGSIEPVIRDADVKSLTDIEREVAALEERARTMRPGRKDSPRATLTLSSLGDYDITQAIAPPDSSQTAALAVGRIVTTPAGMADDTVSLRPMLKLALTLDGRHVDRVEGARFLGTVKSLLEEPFLLAC